jgi:hypothetical protein
MSHEAKLNSALHQKTREEEQVEWAFMAKEIIVQICQYLTPHEMNELNQVSLLFYKLVQLNGKEIKEAQFFLDSKTKFRESSDHLFQLMNKITDYPKEKDIQHFYSQLREDVNVFDTINQFFTQYPKQMFAQKKYKSFDPSQDKPAFYEGLSENIAYGDLTNVIQLKELMSQLNKLLKHYQQSEINIDKRRKHNANVFFGITFTVMWVIIYIAIQFNSPIRSFMNKNILSTLSMLMVVIGSPMAGCLAAYIGSEIGRKQNAADIKNYFQLLLRTISAFENHLDYLLAYHVDLKILVPFKVVKNISDDFTTLEKNTFILGEKNINNIKQLVLIYNQKIILFSPEKLNQLNALFSLDDPDKLNSSTMNKLKEIVHLERNYHLQKIDQRERLIDLLNGEKFKNINSVPLQKIQAAINANPEISNDDLFELVEKKIKNRKKESNGFALFARKENNPLINELYQLVQPLDDTKQLNLKDNVNDRKILIDFIEAKDNFGELESVEIIKEPSEKTRLLIKSNLNVI